MGASRLLGGRPCRDLLNDHVPKSANRRQTLDVSYDLKWDSLKTGELLHIETDQSGCVIDNLEVEGDGRPPFAEYPHLHI